MQSSHATDQHGKFLARSLFDGRMVLLNPSAAIYVFTAGAVPHHIVADVLSKFEFHRNQVYLRTGHGLYVLEHFVHLKDVRAVLSDNYIAGNRGMLIDGHALRYVRGSHTVGIHAQNPNGDKTIEWITLSDAGMREARRKFILRPRR